LGAYVISQVGVDAVELHKRRLFCLFIRIPRTKSGLFTSNTHKLTVFFLNFVLYGKSLRPTASQAGSASDVLAVMLLQRQFGMTAEAGTALRYVL
jgi:hypothetical protein